MAAVSWRRKTKSMFFRMSSVPVESVTDLQTFSTEIMVSSWHSGFFLSFRRHCIALLFLASAVGTLTVQAAPSKSTTLLVVGDSLSAEYGLKRGSGWVATGTTPAAGQAHGHRG